MLLASLHGHAQGEPKLIIASWVCPPQSTPRASMAYAKASIDRSPTWRQLVYHINLAMLIFEFFNILNAKPPFNDSMIPGFHVVYEVGVYVALALKSKMLAGLMD